MGDDREALYELVLERRRLIRRLEELNEILFEVDIRTIEPTLRRGDSVEWREVKGGLGGFCAVAASVLGKNH